MRGPWVVGVWLSWVSALWCAPRVVFSVPAAGPTHGGAHVSGLAVTPGGDVYVAGTIENGMIYSALSVDPGYAAFVTRLDAGGHIRWTTILAAAQSTGASALAVDAAGNAYVVGGQDRGTYSITGGHPSVLPAPHRIGPGSAWVAKLDPGGRVVYFTLFGGSGDTIVSDVAIDAGGSVVVTGHTSSTDFPTTPGAAGGPVRQPLIGHVSYAFVTRFTPDGKSLVFSTCLGGIRATCVPPGGGCLGVVGQTAGTAVLVDGSGRIYVAGSTSAIDFLPESLARGTGFLAVISADGSRLLSATRIPFGPTAMRLTSAGQVVAAATTARHGLPTTPGAAQSEFRGCPPGQYPLCYRGTCICPVNNGYAFQVDVNGRVVRATYLGGHSAAVSDVALDAAGRVWISGEEAGDDFPDTPGSFGRGREFLMELNRDTFGLAQAIRLPAGLGSGSIAFGSDGDLYVGSTQAGLVSRLAFDGSGPAILGVARVGDRLSGTVAPGALVSVYGREIGPRESAHLELDSDGLVGTDLGGSRLFFQGQAAPLLYAQRDQVNAVVPFGVAGMPEVNVELMQAGRVVSSQKLYVVDAEPAILGALNPDGSLNGSSRPAPKGSFVSIYATGFGDLVPRPADGEVPITLLPKPKAPVSVLVRAKPAEILYAGSAPGLVAGVMQVNVRLPDCDLPCQQQLVLKVGSRAASTWVFGGP